MTTDGLEAPLAETLHGCLLKVYYRNQRNDFVAGRFEIRNGPKINIRGPLGQLRENQPVVLSGHFADHPRYGRQFAVTAFEIERPEGEDAVRTYLASGMIKGVGPALAGRIVETLGDGALEIIEEEPGRLREVPGIGDKKAKEILDAVKEQSGLREVLLFLHGHGLSQALAHRILRAYGQDAARLVKNNPYRLAEDLVGVGFKRADEVAGRLGIEADSPERKQAGLLHALSQSVFKEGHCCLPHSELLNRASETLSIPAEALRGSVDELAEQGRIVVQKLPGLPLLQDDQEERVYSLALHLAETGFAAAVETLLDWKPPVFPADRWIRDWEKRNRTELPSGQREALRVALTKPLSIITGGPGVGKTTIIRALCAILEKNGRSALLAAPTGRAAKRIFEATGYEASTIHRLLEFQAGTNRFLRNEHQPLEADFVVIDEVSMLDQHLALHLIRGVRPGTRLILVGDENQLPSVGPGRVLRDLIQSGRIEVVRLMQIFRQSAGSRIVQNAHRILSGELPALTAAENGDFFFIEQRSPEQALATLCRAVTQRIPDAFGLDPFVDIQVLSPMYRGTLGVDRINETLGRILVPQATEVQRSGRRLRVGDKVMQVENNYELNLFNGDLGRIVDLDLEAARARIRFAERELLLPFETLDQIVPAYGITVHRAQGSEYPAVVFALDRAHYLLLNRRVLYTAVTRAQKLLVLVGSRWALERAIGNDEEGLRYTGLEERLSHTARGDGIHPERWIGRGD